MNRGIIIDAGTKDGDIKAEVKELVDIVNAEWNKTRANSAN